MKIIKYSTYNLLLFIFLFSTPLFSQESILRGVITDENGEQVPYVNLIIKGTTKGTVSGFDGSYQLSSLTQVTAHKEKATHLKK